MNELELSFYNTEKSLQSLQQDNNYTPKMISCRKSFKKTVLMMVLKGDADSFGKQYFDSCRHFS